MFTVNSSLETLSAHDFLRESTFSLVNIRWKSENRSGDSGDVWMNEINDPYQLAYGSFKFVVSLIMKVSKQQLPSNRNANTSFQSL